MTNKPDVSADLPLHVAEVTVSKDDLDMGFSEAFIAGRIKLPDGTHKLYTDAVIRAALLANAAGGEPVIEAAKFVRGLVDDLGFTVWSEDGNTAEGVRPLLTDSMSRTRFMAASDWLIKYGFADWDCSGPVELLRFHEARLEPKPQPAAEQEADISYPDTLEKVLGRLDKGMWDSTLIFEAAKHLRAYRAASTAPAAPTAYEKAVLDVLTTGTGVVVQHIPSAELRAEQAAPKAGQDDAPPGWKKTAYGWAQSGESTLAEEQANGAPGAVKKAEPVTLTAKDESGNFVSPKVGDKFVRLNRGSKYEPFYGEIKAVHENKVSVAGTGYIGPAHYGRWWGDLLSLAHVTILTHDAARDAAMSLNIERGSFNKEKKG